MNFGERVKIERNKRDWSQEKLADKLYVSRQAISKWENGHNYPSIEIIIAISDLFGLTIDELLRSDMELKEKLIMDSRQLAHPKLKLVFDFIFLVGVTLLAVKLGVLITNRLMNSEITLLGASFIWNFAPLILMIGAGVASDSLKDKYKKE